LDSSGASPSSYTVYSYSSTEEVSGRETAVGSDQFACAVAESIASDAAADSVQSRQSAMSTRSHFDSALLAAEHVACSISLICSPVLQAVLSLHALAAQPSDHR
jgi:hypothetical protein